MSNAFLKNKFLRRILLLPLAAVLLLAALGGLLFVCGWHDTVTYQEDAVIVLGCGVDGTEPSAQLRCRLDTALAYHQQNPSAPLIVSGGQGSDENDTEAAVMARYLIAGGVPADLVLLEEQATSTAENFRYSVPILAEAVPEYDSVCFITSDFHILRSTILARKAGLTVVPSPGPEPTENSPSSGSPSTDSRTITHLHAPTPTDRVPTNLFREPIVFVKSLLFD